VRILLVHQFFWPDTSPYASILRAIGDHWASEGHEVSVYTTQPSYKAELGLVKQPRTETLGELKVCRARLLPGSLRNMPVRAANAVLFAFALFLHVLRSQKFDVVMCSSQPPILYHPMDLYPEVLRNSKLPAFAFGLLRALDRSTINRADRIVVLSEDMADTLKARGLERSDHIVAQPNFNLPKFGEAEVPGEYRKSKGTFRLLFAGNVGRFQALDNVVEAAKLLADEKKIEIVFLGEGAAKKGLIEQAGELVGDTVAFLPHQPTEVADALMAEADLCLVTLAKDVYRVAYPSKTSSALALGCPVLVVVEPESHLYSFVEREGFG